jgi:formylglycine-generating enzyme required for sulfatase activity
VVAGSLVVLEECGKPRFRFSLLNGAAKHCFVKKPKLSAARFTFAVICLSISSWLAPAVRADDTKVDAAPVKPSVTETNTAKKKDAEAAKETPEKAKEKAAKRLAMFKADQPITNTLEMVLVWVPAGYRVGKYEVTQEQFEKVMKNNPSKFKGGQRPVESVTLSEALQFCQKLTEMELAETNLPPGYSYTLPTEQQYDYLSADANLQNGVLSRLADLQSTENVGTLKPNQFDLHDTIGNVWEWCQEGIARGGSWRTTEEYAVGRTMRFTGSSEMRYDDVGFRCLLQEGSSPSP